MAVAEEWELSTLLMHVKAISTSSSELLSTDSRAINSHSTSSYTHSKGSDSSKLKNEDTSANNLNFTVMTTYIGN